MRVVLITLYNKSCDQKSVIYQKNFIPFDLPNLRYKLYKLYKEISKARGGSRMTFGQMSKSRQFTFGMFSVVSLLLVGAVGSPPGFPWSISPGGALILRDSQGLNGPG